MEGIWRDLKYSFRTLRLNPGFASVVIIELAIGIAASTMIFSVVNSVLWKPLQYQDPQRLVMLYQTNAAKGWDDFTVSPANYIDWRDENHVFEQIAAFRDGAFILTGGVEPERIPAARVSANLFNMLGVRPLFGRTFLAEEDQPGRDQEVVLGYGLWQRRFGRDPSIVNQTITLSGKSFSVVGIMPPYFHFGDKAEVYAPLAFSPEDLRARGECTLTVAARLRDGVPLKRAQSEMDAISRRLEIAYPKSNRGWGARVALLIDVVVGKVRPALLALLGAVAFLLLIVCTNVANLLFARSSVRSGEMAVRTALGASRKRLARQMLTESLVLAGGSGLLGLIVAVFGTRLIVSISPDSIPRVNEIGIDGRVLGFALLVSLLTGIVFGLMPGRQAWRANPNEGLREIAPGATSAKRGRFTRNLLVTAEIALSVVLLIGAGLLIKTFQRVRETKLGFDPNGVLTLRVTLPGLKYREPAQVTNFIDDLLGRLAARKEVQAAGATTLLPFAGDDIESFMIRGQPVSGPSEMPSATCYLVTPGYFDAMKIQLIKGRLFNDQDREGSPRVVVIGQSLAHRYFADQDPLGKQIRFNDGSKIYQEVVGVVGDVRQYGMDGAMTPEVYQPFAQSPLNFVALAVRTRADAPSLAAAVRSQVYEIDPNQPVTAVESMDQVVSDSLAPRRLTTVLMFVFAAVATVLALLGLYGVVAYSLNQRTHEFGIRSAVGAGPRDISFLVARQALGLALVGTIVGLGLAFGLARVLSGLLVAVSPHDPGIFVAVPAAFWLALLAASCVPARRALKIDPIAALRYQ